jgi:methylmalonyl-CoA mutase C-terminal domain/subunit
MPKGRILIAKLGLDGHDRGARLITRILREGGFEVLYTGMRQTPETVANAAMQEDVDAIGISILSGSHMTLVPRLIEVLRQQGMADIPIVVGGIVPDAEDLIASGVSAVFGPGSGDAHIIDTLTKLIEARSELESQGETT